MAKLNLAACLNKNDAPGALADATRIYEELLGTWRRTLGLRNQRTLVVSANLSMSYEEAGNTEAALALAEESLAVLRQGRLRGGHLFIADDSDDEEDELELDIRMDLLSRTLGTASRLYARLGRHAAARPLMEAAVDVSKEAGDAGSRVHAMSNLGVCLSNIGDIQAGRQVKTDAMLFSQRVLGPTHPQTLSVVDSVRQSEALSISNGETDVQGARAIGRLVGLSKAGLNGALVFVLGYVADKGRYKVSTHGSETSFARHARAAGAKPLGIKPDNLVLKSGSAVVVTKKRGNAALPAALVEYEGVRCIVQNFDGERSEEAAQTGQGEYSAMLCWSAEAGAGKALRLPLGCCLLESMISEPATPEPEPPPVSAQPSFRATGVRIEAVGDLAAELGLPEEGRAILRRMGAPVPPADGLPQEEEAELGGESVTAMGCGKMVPLEDDY